MVDEKNSFAVFNSNDIYPIGADSTFHLNSTEIFFLTGIDQEETILLLSPQDKEIKNRENLLLKKQTKNSNLGRAKTIKRRRKIDKWH